MAPSSYLSREELAEIEDGLHSFGCQETYFQSDTEDYREAMKEKKESERPGIEVWADTGKKEIIPRLNIGFPSIARVSALGHFTADALDYAYDLGNIEDYEIFMSSVLTYVTQKESGMQPKVRIRTKRTLLDKFKKFYGLRKAAMKRAMDGLSA